MNIQKLLTNCLLVFLLLGISFSSYSQKTEHQIVNPETLQKDFSLWWAYNYQNIIFSETYIPLDPLENVINRDKFFELLCTGDYIVIRVEKNSQLFYKLIKLNDSSDKSIKDQVRNFGLNAFQQFKQEGKTIPDFNFTDLNGNVYNKENTKGKIIVLKCWFINCMPCRKEMPELNKMVQQYKDRNDILFLSMAYDSEEDLKKFLKTIEFDYATISISEAFLSQKLQVHGYPTHLLIGKDGLIIKVMNRSSEIANALKIEVLK